MADDGPLQLSLFDEQDLAEITSDDFPGERLIACRNPALADERARKREDLLAATEKLLAPVTARVAAGADRVRARSAPKSARSSASTRWPSTSTSPSPITSLTAGRNQDRIGEEARLDGIYVIRTPLPAAELDAAATVTAYKNLKYVERGKPDCCHKRVRSSSSALPSVSELVLAS